MLFAGLQCWVQYSKQMPNLAYLSYHQYEVHSRRFLTTNEPTNPVNLDNWMLSTVAVVYVVDVPPYRCAQDLQGIGLWGGGGVP